MSIKPSAATEIRTLVAALSSGDEIKRETAIARLAILGPRAVDRMVAAYPTADRETRIALLRAFEAIADPRALRHAREALEAGGDVAVAGAAALRALLNSPADSTSAEALDALVATALARTAERRVRVAAFDALRDMPADIRERVEAALREDPERAVHPPKASKPVDTVSADAVWEDAIEGRLPDDPSALREGVDRRGTTAPLSVLHRLIGAVRARELETTGSRQSAWRSLRGALHQALGLRGSTIAVYDLRETLAGSKDPLPASFIAALHAVGDASCLEPIAAAHAGASTGSDAHQRWRAQLEGAFKSIASREKVSRRSAVFKRVEKKWPASAAALLRTR